MSLTDSAAWHRAEAASAERMARGYDQTAVARGYANDAAHHTRAALLMEALPVVAELLADLSRAQKVETWEPPTPDASAPGTGWTLTDDQRAALSTLAKAGDDR